MREQERGGWKVQTIKTFEVSRSLYDAFSDSFAVSLVHTVSVIVCDKRVYVLLRTRNETRKPEIVGKLYYRISKIYCK